MRRLFIVVTALLALGALAHAQIWIMSPASQQSAGSHGPPPVGCANQFVLDYSNSCALIGQGWGE